MRKLFAVILFIPALIIWSTTVSVGAGEALTVSALEAQGKEPLGETALRALIFGKTLVVRNRATGELFEATYGENGQRILMRLTEGQIQKSAVYAFHGGPVSEGVAPYEIRDGKIVTTFDGKTFEVRIFRVEGKYVASRSGEGDAVNWELVESKPAEASEETLTVSSLRQRGIKPLDAAALTELIVEKTLMVRNRATGELYEATYSADGYRQVRNITQERLHHLAYQAFHGGSVPEGVAPYEIRDGKIVTTFDGKTFEVTVYDIDGKYVGARSGEGGAVNWEVVEKQ
jgi:hypothetical protein